MITAAIMLAGLWVLLGITGSLLALMGVFMVLAVLLLLAKRGLL